MGIISETLELIRDNQSKEFNSIPFRFKTLEDNLNGINQGTYYHLGAYSGAGKTTLADDLFLFSAFDWLKKYNFEKQRATWFYYSFEINKYIKIAKAASRRIFHTTGKQLNVNYILSKGLKNRISDEDYQLVKKNLEYYEELEDFLHIYDEPVDRYQIRNDLYNFCTHPDFAEIEYEYFKVGDKEKKRIVRYKKKDPNHFVFVVIDHASLVKTSSGSKLKESMDAMSADLVYLRNKFDIIPIVVQQVGTEAINRTSQLNRMIDIGPEDFSDTKYIYRDFLQNFIW